MPLIRERLGIVARYPFDTPSLLNQRVAVARDIQQLNEGYLYWVLRSPQFRNHATTSCTGGLQNNTSTKYLETFMVPKPPLEEQERIAAELDDKIAGVKLAEASIQQELDTIEAMPAALLRKAFSGAL